MKENQQKLIQKAYDNFNSRNIPEVLSTMKADVVWPKGFEGGYEIGHNAVEEYWTRQWKEINPKVEPLKYHFLNNGEIEVDVQQLVKDLHGNILYDGIVKHTYTLENELIKRMEIN